MSTYSQNLDVCSETGSKGCIYEVQISACTVLSLAQVQRPHTALHAAVAERPGVAANIYVQPSGKGLGFYTGEDGYLYVDNLRIDDIRAEVCMAPCPQHCS